MIRSWVNQDLNRSEDMERRSEIFKDGDKQNL